MLRPLQRQVRPHEDPHGQLRLHDRGGVVQAGVSNFWLFALGRLIAAISPGTATATIGGYINELPPPHMRNTLGLGLYCDGSRMLSSTSRSNATTSGDTVRDIFGDEEIKREFVKLSAESFDTQVVQAWRNPQRRKVALADFSLLLFAHAVKIHNSIRRATAARINEASVRIREHLAATDEPPLHQIVWRCGTSLRSMRVSRMELSQQFLNMQRIVNCALLTKLAARWRKSNKRSKGG
ncbi:hypothetical protein GQ600_12907 [Phytophthora cactorum]|nr:hypothetical protein GQ600_12907 [Phytophthora cactorum]